MSNYYSEKRDLFIGYSVGFQAADMAPPALPQQQSLRGKHLTIQEKVV